MSNIPEDRLYTPTHEWIQITNNIATIGITDHAQSELGDLVFVQLPEVRATIAQSDELAVVESVKAASDLYAPVAGVVVEVNEEVVNSPELVNDAPYESWLVKIEMADDVDLSELLDSQTYGGML